MRRHAWALALSAVLAGQPVLARAPAAAVQRTQFVPVDGVRNFRDVGGYRTADGRTVRRGVLYRSGALGSMTPRGRAEFARLGVASIVDLRSAGERAKLPEDWLGTRRLSYWTRDYDMGHGVDPARPQSMPRTPEAIRAMMYGAYRTLPKQMAPSYRELFQRLIAGRSPVVLNCTAGKDRTGIGSALVLHALGVPYETIRRDFLLSNEGIDVAGLRPTLPSPDLAALPDAALRPLAGVEEGYLDTTFAQLRQDYGSVDGFLHQELGVGPREIAQLRRRMLK
ncbi:MAG: tyrosine-protein phosphatase [Novosphingobium sp.]